MSAIQRVQPTWFCATERRQELLSISEAHSWVSHWDVERSRSRRCGGQDCYCCAIGLPKVLRVVLLCLDSSGREKLLELRDRHRDLWEQYDSLAGARLVVRKEGTARNSPVSIKVVEFSHVVVRDISRLTDCLGLHPILVREGFNAELERADIAPSEESGASLIA